MCPTITHRNKKKKIFAVNKNQLNFPSIFCVYYSFFPSRLIEKNKHLISICIAF